MQVNSTARKNRGENDAEKSRNIDCCLLRDRGRPVLRLYASR